MPPASPSGGSRKDWRAQCRQWYIIFSSYFLVMQAVIHYFFSFFLCSSFFQQWRQWYLFFFLSFLRFSCNADSLRWFFSFSKFSFGLPVNLTPLSNETNLVFKQNQWFCLPTKDSCCKSSEDAGTWRGSKFGLQNFSEPTHWSRVTLRSGSVCTLAALLGPWVMEVTSPQLRVKKASAPPLTPPTSPTDSI